MSRLASKVSMSGPDTALTAKPGHSTKLRIGQTFFGPACQVSSVGIFQDYFEYYVEELGLLSFGTSPQARLSANLAVRTHDDILLIVSILRNNLDSKRSDLRVLLQKDFNNCDDRALDRSVDLSIRLWLMINFQEKEYQGLRPLTPCISWGEGTTLRAFLESLFPRSRWKITAKVSRLHPYFTAANMARICGLEIKYTTSLQDHLHLDRRRKTLQIFPYKCCLQAMLSGSQARSVSRQLRHRKTVAKKRLRLPIPSSVLVETILSLDLLFPAWDRRTNELLEKHGQSFHQTGPFEVSRTLNLMDFDHWRDRLLEVYEEIFQSPPVSWAQLWRDRRNPQQFWTFWIALAILALTVVSTLTGIIQAWASVKSLRQ